ncbi:MAG: hypothetical protein ABIP37_01195 [Methylotenera sp.]
MSFKSLRLSLILPMIVMAVLPLISAWFAYQHTHTYLQSSGFPPVFVEQPPGFSLTIFILLAIVELAFIVFLIFPQWFGFVQLNPQPEPPGKALPIWFWLGLATTLFFWWLMWTRETIFGSLVYYAFTPLW